MTRIRVAYEEAKIKGLVRSRPITLDETGKPTLKDENLTADL